MRCEVVKILALKPYAIMPEDLEDVLIGCHGMNIDQACDYDTWLGKVWDSLKERYQIMKKSRWADTADDYIQAAERVALHRDNLQMVWEW